MDHYSGQKKKEYSDLLYFQPHPEQSVLGNTLNTFIDCDNVHWVSYCTIEVTRYKK